MDPEAGQRLLKSLLEEGECEWIEFKKSSFEPDREGRYCSALSNGARLKGKPHGYIAWGVANDGTVVGTTVNPSREKAGQQPFEFWLKGSLTPKGQSFRLHQIDLDGKRVVLLEVDAASTVPVRFRRIAYIRIGDATPALEDHPDLERELQKALADTSFETDLAIENVTGEDVHGLLDAAEALSRLSRKPVPGDPAMQLEQLRGYGLIHRTAGERWAITNHAAILFARELKDFGPRFARRAARVVFYDGESRVSGRQEGTGHRGYALGLEELFEWLETRLPRSETLRGALRVDQPLYPMEALRELIANALIHQDFGLTGTGPMIEIFSDRIEISNPGVPLVDVDRMLDEPPRSRNERVAALMRHMNFCEERGSGIDKVVFRAEVFQLPPPDFAVRSSGFTATMFAPRGFAEMTPTERVRACYQHACLLWAGGGKHMTNSSLRSRFGLSGNRASQISRLIAEAIEAGAIKPVDPENRSRAQASYQPYWA
jgi:ATP-dependent DNA helicase RecG